MRERALRLLLERIAEMESSRASAVLAGAPETFEKYREQVGFLQALAQVRDACGQIENKLHAPDKRP